MILAVLDTNVLVSGLGWPSGAPGRVVDLALGGRFLPATSPPLLDELERVLRYPRLVKVFEEPDAIVSLVEDMSLVVEPTFRVSLVADEADNRVLEAARAAQASFIVTGDEELLALRKFEGAKLTRPAEFLKLINDA